MPPKTSSVIHRGVQRGWHDCAFSTREVHVVAVTFATVSGDLPGYLAFPSSAGPWPGVVVVMDAVGLSDDIRAQAERLVQAGYLALAPDLFARGGRMRCVSAAIRASRSGTVP